MEQRVDHMEAGLEEEGAGPDRSRAESLFADWVVRTPASEPADLEHLIGQHPGFETELRELERQRRALHGFERDLAARSPSAASGSSSRPPLRLDEFECRARIGRGGMGEVWEAYDHALKRSVALKLLPAGVLAGERELARFAREAEACARVRHENVVAIFKAGSDQGLHYIAQELVAGGRTLRDEIEEGRRRGELRPDAYRSLAELFLGVARALAAAHEAGVVHRDVKPQNILIAPDGSPRVADFGLALLEGGLTLSRSGDFLGTYFYASPEQVRPDGSEIDARSDVFGLGATLYECLTFRRPFEGDSVQAVVHAITRDDPPDPRKIRSSVPDDLAVIALKALEKRRESRYASMRELERDLERYLAHEPILARAPSRVRRVQKWMRRHPTSSATVLLSILALAGLFALWRNAERQRGLAEDAQASLARSNEELRASQEEARRQADMARTEAELSREVESFLTDLFQSADPDLYGVEELTLREVVERGREQLVAGEVEQPEVRARLATTLGNLLRKLGAFPESTALIEEAAAIWRELGREDGPAVQETKLALAIVAIDEGRDADGLAILDELEERQRAGELVPELAWSVQRGRGLVLTRLGRWAEAERAMSEAEELAEASLPSDSNELCVLRYRRGELLWRQGRFAEVEALLAEGSARLEPLLDSGNVIAIDHFTLLGLVWQSQGRLEAAEELLLRVARAAEQRLGADHARTMNARINLATVLQEEGKLDIAESVFREVCAASAARYGRGSPEEQVARHDLANCLSLQRRFAEAEPLLRELYDELRRVQGEEHMNTLRTRASLAYCLRGQGRTEEAALILEDVLAALPPDAGERPALEIALDEIRAGSPAAPR